MKHLSPRRTICLLLAVFMALTCAGCAADQLYALPQLTDEYVQLEELIAQRIRSGGEYAAPMSGSNRQTVQLHDLDGDGTPEAIAFLADRSHTPNVCVYRQDEEGNYYLFVAIEGVGSAVDSAEYADLTGNGANELILSWQIGGDIRLLTVYTLREEEQTQLLSTDCVEFTVCDLDGDGVGELMDLTDDYASGLVTRYDFSGGDGDYTQSDALLSDGVEKVLRMRPGYLTDGTAALFVESTWGEDELITDVLTASDGSLENITRGSSGRSYTLRAGGAFAADINGDRAMEIPDTDGDMLRWYGINPSGERELALSTYHDYDDGWYLVLPEELLGASVGKKELAPGETAVTFTGGDGGVLLTIYRLTGENRLDRAEAEGRVILAQDGATVYAAASPAEGGLSLDGIAEQFNLIYQEWQTGAL